MKCFYHAGSVNCAGNWTDDATGCSVSCGNGTKKQTFHITTPAANGGANCTAADLATQNVQCNLGTCSSMSVRCFSFHFVSDQHQMEEASNNCSCAEPVPMVAAGAKKKLSAASDAGFFSFNETNSAIRQAALFRRFVNVPERWHGSVEHYLFVSDQSPRSTFLDHSPSKSLTMAVFVRLHFL